MSEKIKLVKPSIDKLRWALAGGSLGLLLLLVGVVGYGRYRAAMLWKHRLNGLGIQVEQTTDNVTFSKTIGGRTVFTLRAGKAIQHKNGKTILHNVQLTLYGKRDGSEDRIYGSEFEYDDKAGIARALGDVEMDLRAPGSLSKAEKAGGAPAAADGNAGVGRDIHVRTSGLTYVRKLGVAATDQPVMFSYAGLQCSAKGAEFQSSEDVVHLLANVELQGMLHGKHIALHATKADLDHDSDVVALAVPTLESGDEKASAGSAVLHLRHDGSIETVHAEGNVVLQKQTRRVDGVRLDSRFTAENSPAEASLTGGVTFVDTDPSRPARGSAGRVDGTFDNAGTPVKWTASGGTQLVTAVRSASGRMLSRTMKGDRIESLLSPGQNKARHEISELHLSGAAQAAAESANGDVRKTTSIAADDLRAFFAGGRGTERAVVRKVIGTGHTRLEQNGTDGAHQASTGNTVQLSFAPNPAKKDDLQIATATQDGDVHFESRTAKKPNAGKNEDPVAAKADHSIYNGTTHDVSLTGNAHFQQGTSNIAANSMLIHEATGDSDAEGSVLATLAPGENRSSADVTHIRADRAHLVRSTQIGTFVGSDTRPARLWQGPSQVEAASIIWDGIKRTLAARPDSASGLVHAVFASVQSESSSATGKKQESQVERVLARNMDYDDLDRTATFTGNLQMQGQTGGLQAQHAQMFFETAPVVKSAALSPNSGGVQTAPLMGGSLRKAVAWGDVRLNQTGKTGRGEKLVYTAADSSFVLTGTPSHPPQIVDAERGNLTGASLTFHSGDNTVVVSGSSSGAAPAEHVRVHTETGAKQ